MNATAPIARDILRRGMVARIATLSRNGRPSANPLYFIQQDGKIWLGTVDWTLAARNVTADPRVSVLIEWEQAQERTQVLRISGKARLRTDPQAMRTYNLRVAVKYLLKPGAIRNMLAHLGQLGLQAGYRRQNAQKGRPCVIEVTPEQVELFKINKCKIARKEVN